MLRGAITGQRQRTLKQTVHAGPRGDAARAAWEVLAGRVPERCFVRGRNTVAAEVAALVAHVAHLRAEVIPALQAPRGDAAPRRAGLAGAELGEAVLRAVLAAGFGWDRDERPPVARAIVVWGEKPSGGGARTAKYLKRPDRRSFVGLLREWELPRRLRWECDRARPRDVCALVHAGVAAVARRAAPPPQEEAAPRIPAVPLREEVVQHLPDAPEPGPPHPCRLCAQAFRSRERLADHINRTHGGDDRYRGSSIGHRFPPLARVRPPGLRQHGLRA